MGFRAFFMGGNKLARENTNKEVGAAMLRGYTLMSRYSHLCVGVGMAVFGRAGYTRC